MVPSWRYLLSLLACITLLGVVTHPLLIAASPGVLQRNGDGQRVASDDFTTVPGAVGFGNLPWQQNFGDWVAEGGEARLVTGNPAGGPSYVTVETGAANLRVAARSVVPTIGWGLTFRYANPFDYAYLVINTEYASVNVGIVKGIDDTLVAVFGPAPIAPGMEVVADLAGDELLVTIDGTFVGRVLIPDAGEGTRAGLIGLAQTVGTARWDDVRIEAFE